jgi:4-hydroxy-tetrahydrodipicolinate synthase
MKEPKKYSGIVVPAVTPLTDSFQLDEEAVANLFKHFYDHQLSPFILGTTGEAASLPPSVKKHYIRAAQECKRPGSLLYSGISSNAFQESVELAKYCADHEVDVVVATLPSYYMLTELQMRKHFESLAEAVPLPLVIYNIPATIHMSIPLSVIDELSHHPNIIGTKDSERNEERLKHSLDLWKNRKDFSHFLGWAAKSAEALQGGCDGLVPSTGNLTPEIYEVMFESVQEGDQTTAAAMQHLSDVFSNLYQTGRTLGESLAALKLLMKEKELCREFMMPPLVTLSTQEEEKLLATFRELNSSRIL